MKKREWSIGLLIVVGVATLGFLPASAQLNCPSGFSTSGICGAGGLIPGGGSALKVVGSSNGTTPALSGTKVVLIPKGATHAALSLNYQTQVNVQDFTSTFTFVPNGQNIAFVLQNDNICTGSTCFLGPNFSSGAGCEAGFYQAFAGNSAVNNIFALELDNWSYLGSTQSFSYSSAQIYSAGQSPCNPNDSGPNYVLINKVSTSPVALNSPATTQGTSTGDTYSATVTYDGSNFTLSLYDVTAGGACPGAKCFTHTWTNVNIPSLVGSSMAYAGFTAATGETSTYPLYVRSFTYADGVTPPPTAAPTFTPAAGTYSATSVTLADATSSANIYYTTNGTAPTTSSTQYSGPISVSSTETLQAIAVASGDSSSAVASALYTITVPEATTATPTFSPAAGTYPVTAVTLSDATSGATIYYTTNGSTPTTSSTQYTGPITVSATETLEAIAVVTGDINSAVASAAYTITAAGVGSPMTCLPLQSIPGSSGMLQTSCTIVLTP
jgi:hypothetical protein